MTPRIEAYAFMIWRFAAARDWNVNYDEIARATGLGRNEIGRAIYVKGWGGRIRSARGRELIRRANAFRTSPHNIDPNLYELTDLIR
ncbi:MAG: hypothetical protein Unbinned3138contig1000_20 [Prokaryotic dsDNA virus sp.]|nr:MAG: hypothetical protein Unbinned3138contig1000_20 [Prokaryotic dsDNA virus sp.]|tara:strand:+ start:3780 stop:4040 length:261 start_codon:yes stop_codon:yes gene_type:complete